MFVFDNLCVREETHAKNDDLIVRKDNRRNQQTFERKRVLRTVLDALRQGSELCVAYFDLS